MGSVPLLVTFSLSLQHNFQDVIEKDAKQAWKDVYKFYLD